MQGETFHSWIRQNGLEFGGEQKVEFKKSFKLYHQPKLCPFCMKKVCEMKPIVKIIIKMPIFLISHTNFVDSLAKFSFNFVILHCFEKFWTLCNSGNFRLIIQMWFWKTKNSILQLPKRSFNCFTSSLHIYITQGCKCLIVKHFIIDIRGKGNEKCLYKLSLESVFKIFKLS